ncbi:MAG: S41 family peptidase [Planctomycetota bacterium]|jgi:C-terminal peptidase prc
MLGILLATLAPVCLLQSGDLAKQLDDTLARLESSQGAARWELAGELREIAHRDSTEAVPHLIAAASRHPGAVQLVIAATLTDVQAYQPAADLLLPMVDGERASEALELLSDRKFKNVAEVPERMLLLLESPLLPAQRLEVARVLHSVGDLERRALARSVLLDGLESDDPETRALAALTLGEIGQYEDARPVLNTLRSDPGVRGQLARAYLDTADTIQNYLEKLYRQSEQIEPQREQSVERPALSQTKGSLDVLEELIQRIQENHLVGEQLAGADGRELLVTAAARGMLAALDPHSTYFTSKEFERWILELRRNYAGIGAYVDTINGEFTITRPIYSGPAAEAGLLSGDRILRVDGWVTREQTNDEIIRRLKGEPGTEVTITVHRDGWPETRDFVLRRAAIHIDSVHWDMLPGRIGFVEVVGFAEDTTKELMRAIDALQAEDMRGLILDLRNNSGGYLEEAVATASLYLPRQQLVVYTEGRGVDRVDYLTRPNLANRYSGPLVVLVNERSASASEIVSGALQDTGRALVVGEQTFGKGSVQQAMPLETRPGDRLLEDPNANGVYDPGEQFDDRDGDGAFTYPVNVKITNARYYLPSGRSIHTELDLDGRVVQHGGVTPDLEVDFEGLEPWENAEIARMYDRLAKRVAEDEKFKDPFDKYVEARFEQHKELFYALADNDGLDPSRYPDFEALRESLDAEHLSDDTIRMILRRSVRDRVADDRRQTFPGGFMFGDWQEDSQMQAAIREMARMASLDLKSVEAYAAIAAASAVEAEDETAPR